MILKIPVKNAEVSELLIRQSTMSDRTGKVQIRRNERSYSTAIQDY